MTEADLYPHLAHLAGGQVYPYVVPLLDGRPSVALPWVQIRQDAREAIMLLAPGSVSEMQDYIPENRCYRATLEFQVTV
ncbi:hypothetical protein DIV28_31590 [Escherichia coli]|uniref:hypothetical protein n=1 Tax=Escherichia coli TaxID=562 RepID=UPI000DAB9095|nr:hypothetical protein [Escherichia coli]PZZ41370.1 hypothetical protein DIV28_31590 [Escherichia coli]